MIKGVFNRASARQNSLHLQHKLWRALALLNMPQMLLCFPTDNYEALAGLVDLMRRSGKLEEVPKFLEAAESATGRASMEGGFNYCKGLYEW